MWHDTKSAVLLTGYQAKRTNGRMLQEERALYIKGWRTEVQCEVHNFPFSGHSDQRDLIEFIQQVNPRHLIIQHGDPDASEDLKNKAEELGMQCAMYTPSVGEEIDIK
jgi:Cft2 family RNA processing exonuclease